MSRFDRGIWMLYVLAALALLAGCAFEPDSRVPFTPPVEYRAIWAMAEQCSGRRGDFDRVRFYSVSGDRFESPHGESAGWTAGDEITIAEWWIHDTLVVKHEMIHALGVKGHPVYPFEVPCHATWKSEIRSAE